MPLFGGKKTAARDDFALNPYIPGAEPAISAALTTGALPYATIPAVPVGYAPTAYGAPAYGAPFAPTAYGAPFAPTAYGAPLAPTYFGAGAPAGSVVGVPPIASGPSGTALLNKKSAVALANAPQLSSFPGSEVLPLAEVTAFGIPRGTAIVGTGLAARPALPAFNPETEAFIRYAAAAQGIHPNEFLRRVGQDPRYLDKTLHSSMRNDRSTDEILRMISPYLSRPGIFVP